MSEPSESHRASEVDSPPGPAQVADPALEPEQVPSAAPAPGGAGSSRDPGPAGQALIDPADGLDVELEVPADATLLAWRIADARRDGCQTSEAVALTRAALERGWLRRAVGLCKACLERDPDQPDLVALAREVDEATDQPPWLRAAPVSVIGGAVLLGSLVCIMALIKSPSPAEKMSRGTPAASRPLRMASACFL